MIKKGRYLTIGIVLPLLIVWGLYIYYQSVESIDSLGYYNEFLYAEDWLKSNKADHLSFYLMILIKKLGGDYQIYRLIVGIFYFIPMIIILKGKFKNTFDNFFFTFLTLIYPFLLSIVTLRNTIASSVVIMSYYYFFRSKKKIINIAITIIGIIMASYFHDSSLIYLLFIMAYLFVNKVFKNNVALCIKCLCILDFIAICLIKSNVLNNLLYSKITTDTDVMYLDQMKTAGMGFTLLMMFQIFLTIILYKIYYNQKNKNKNNSILKLITEKNSNEMNFELCQDIMYLNIVMLLLMPLYAINCVFFRIYRNIFMLNAIIFAGNYQNKTFFRLLIVLCYILIFVWDSGLIIWEGILV